MRIASIQFAATMNRSLTLNQDPLARLTQQMASGTRILVPSDDPIANVRVSRLQREEAIVSQYIDNIAAVQVRLNKSEAFLDSMVADMNEARDLLVWAPDTSNTADDLHAMVNSLVSLRDSIYYTANQRDQENNYAFSGTQTDLAAMGFDPAAAAGSRYTYQGNTNKQEVVVGNGVTQDANVDVSGLEVFLNSLDIAIEGLAAATTTGAEPVLHGQLGDALRATDDAMALISGKIATLGGAGNVLKTLEQNHANVSLSNKTAIHDIGALDYAVAATELNGYNLALQATYKSYAQISGLSLFNVI
ncbi:flagellar hook-associated protein FlgL [Massilia endophytica]|uniref:flagellar hook-associated protein FlgL n=1 Tax=Massilia endophytica TaxID=2899220 RepID=UPI001E4EED8C|nr:flagellar hook-associated protein FlgL [Massilia endophytica]UGQ48987.1 flagellar hook-associated protein FlgL [Massilia endophytica]